MRGGPARAAPGEFGMKLFNGALLAAASASALAAASFAGMGIALEGAPSATSHLPARGTMPIEAAPMGYAQDQADRPAINASPPAAPQPNAAPSYAFPALAVNSYGVSYGFSVPGGVKLNADYLSPGDRLWLEATYEKGPFSFMTESGLGFSYSASGQNSPAAAPVPPPNDNTGWNAQPWDCGITSGGSCQKKGGWDITGAYKSYWLPTLSSGIYGSYMEMHYPGFGGGNGIPNIKEGQSGTNSGWTALRGFDIGAEFMYVHLNQMQPAGPAPDAGRNAASVPSSQPSLDQTEGRLRVERAF